MVVSSRTVIASCTSTIDFKANAFNPTEARRTRKRISAAQLAHLEELYRQSSHPSRDERDALAKRIQMETKSVTIWFQNKRQTDRKVALHNATNSRNVMLVDALPQATPDITLTAPTSPAYPSLSREPEVVKCEVSSEALARCQPAPLPAPPKRSSSLASFVTSTTTSTSKTRISLDRVASRSEIRFTNRDSPSCSSNGSCSRSSDSISLERTSYSSSATPPLSRTASQTSQATPASPLPPASPPLWETMLSSPLAPSSPPPPEFLAFARSRRARTLGLACVAALSNPDSVLPSWSQTNFSASQGEVVYPLGKASDPATHAREYEEATSVTEDEAELITPQGSQDVPSPWHELSQNSSWLFSKPLAKDASNMSCAMEGIDAVNNMPLVSRGWEEDEMHAALALCGLRG